MRKLTLTIATAMLAIATVAVAGETITAEVKKIDEGAGKITLKHGAARAWAWMTG